MKRGIVTAFLLIIVLAFPSQIRVETYINAGKDIQATRTDQPPAIDGHIDESCWQKAPKATGFVDILSGSPAKDQTIGILLYDDQGFIS